KVEVFDRRRHRASRSSCRFFGTRMWRALIDDLLQQRPRIEVDVCGRDLPLRRIELVDATTAQFDASIGSCTASQRTLLFALESKFAQHDVSSKNHVLHHVAISGEAGDEGPDELLAKRRFSLDEAARNLNRHVVRVVGQDAILIRSVPRVVVLEDERFELNNGSGGSRGGHPYLLWPRFAASVPDHARDLFRGDFAGKLARWAAGPARGSLAAFREFATCRDLWRGLPDSELSHSRAKRAWIDGEQGRRAPGSADTPVGRVKCAADGLALGILQRHDV